ncbi:MAG TPA: YdcF family protein [Bryobacteraceae bacterium]|nr:YdcF family protein [Bryobacteraceae bacterium]
MRNQTLVRRLAGFVIAAILILLAIATVRWQATLTALGAFLVDSQPPQKADLVLVLGGDFLGARVLIGAELARQRYAPLVLLSGPPYQGRPEGAVAVDFLVKKGYPRDLFRVFPTNAASTIAEAEALRGELIRRQAKQVLLVTSNYHSRRAEIVLTLFCPGVHFISIPAPDSQYHAALWWQDDSSRHLFFSEWSKILGSVLAVYPAYLISRLFGRSGPAQLLAGCRAHQHFSNLDHPLGFGDPFAS